MTKAEAAKLVRRVVQEVGKDKQTVSKEVPVTEAEVLSFKNYGEHVIVVTTDGRKLRGAKK